MGDRICLVTGVGPGTGAALARRFADGGYRVATLARNAARRGKASFAGFAPTKAAQRILAESLARSLGPKGVHVAYAVIDGVIDVPWTRQVFSDRPDSYFVKPQAIADAVHHVAHQDRSAWTFELDLRPFAEEW